MSYRNTKQRKDVYEVLKGLDKHLTADQVMEALSENDKKVGLATVYRNLNHQSNLLPFQSAHLILFQLILLLLLHD